MKNTNFNGNRLLRDIVIVLASIAVAVFVAKSGLISDILSSVQGAGLLVSSFIAGLFFTSIFTTVPAMVVLGELAREHNLIMIALVGAAGAVIGDIIILKFIRKHFSHHIKEAISRKLIGSRIKVMFNKKLFRWASFFVGGMIIAFPMLPDELGISIASLSRMDMRRIIALSYCFNVIGIIAIGLIASAI